MRERISRGKRFDNGEWIYWNRYGRLTDINGEPTKIEINTSALRPYAFYINELPVIREDTVGDYTGVTDKNGKRIFEGDIVRVPFYTLTQKMLIPCEIEYQNDCAQFALMPIKESDSGLSMDWYDDIEVIGNIHDNPELLEE